MDIQTIKEIESGNLEKAHSLLEKDLYQRAGSFLKEKKKQIVAKTWGKTRPKQDIHESDSKSILAASKRKAFREKMLKLKATK